MNNIFEPQLIPPRKTVSGHTVYANSDDIIDEKVVSFSNGFYSVENLENKKIRWMSTDLELDVYNKSNYELLIIKTKNIFNSKRVVVQLLDTNSENYKPFSAKQYLIDEEVELVIPLIGVKKIKISSDYFCPFENNISNDSRKLSFLIDWFFYIKENKKYQQSVEYIYETNFDIYDELLKSEIVIPQTDFYFKYESKKINIKTNLSSGILLYLPFYNEKIKKCLDNFNTYKLSKKNIELIIFSDSDDPFFSNSKYNIIKIPKIPFMKHGGFMAPQDKYALIAFLHGIQIASSKKLDRYFYYEWDCKIGVDYWYDDLWDELMNWPYEAYMTGTPVLKYNSRGIGNFIQNHMDYIYNYSKETGVSMVIESVNPFCLFTNGALTFYHTEKIKNMFIDELNKIDQNNFDFVNYTHSWDYESGIRLFKKYKEHAFKYVGWLKSSYSGCGEYYYNSKQREYMLESKLKKVIHQYKYI